MLATSNKSQVLEVRRCGTKEVADGDPPAEECHPYCVGDRVVGPQTCNDERAPRAIRIPGVLRLSRERSDAGAAGAKKSPAMGYQYAPEATWRYLGRER